MIQVLRPVPHFADLGTATAPAALPYLQKQSLHHMDSKCTSSRVPCIASDSPALSGSRRDWDLRFGRWDRWAGIRVGAGAEVDAEVGVRGGGRTKNLGVG